MNGNRNGNGIRGLPAAYMMLVAILGVGGGTGGAWWVTRDVPQEVMDRIDDRRDHAIKETEARISGQIQALAAQMDRQSKELREQASRDFEWRDRVRADHEARIRELEGILYRRRNRE